MRVEVESIHHSNDLHEEHDMRISADVAEVDGATDVADVSWKCVSKHRCNVADLCSEIGLDAEDRERLTDEYLYQSAKAYRAARDELSRVMDLVLRINDGAKLQEITEKLKGVAA